MPESCRAAIISRISDRSMTRSCHCADAGREGIGRWAQAVVASAIGAGEDLQTQLLWCGNGRRRCRIAAPCKNVQDHIGTVRACSKRFSACFFHRAQPIALNRGEDVDHLPTTVLHTLELALYPAQRPWHLHERCTVAQGARLLL